MLNGISNSNQKPQGPILARLLLTKKKKNKNPDGSFMHASTVEWIHFTPLKTRCVQILLCSEN